MAVENERSADPDLASGVSNVVAAATVSGVVVQAGTVFGGLHVHPVAPTHPVPQQLPGAPASFTGRAGDLANLTVAVDALAGRTGAVMITALAGAGGIGKTWLVVHWAHTNCSQFPDGQLFVDLRGFSPEVSPMAVGVAVRGFLDALGVEPGRVPPDLHAQIGLYRSLVAGKQMLIVLDNAATADQVIPLLPGASSCAVVVTSRRTLTGLVTRHGAHHLRLDRLTDDEARDLLTVRLGATRMANEPDAVNDLLTYCAGFPLALAIVAGRAHTAPQVPLASFVAELRNAVLHLDFFDDNDPAASLPTVLSWSYQSLTTEQQRMFALLGIVPGPSTDLLAAASLAGVPLSGAQALMRALQESSLVDRNAGGRYTMHDLTRAYAVNTAREHLDEEARSSALRRVLDFYVHTAYAADCALNPYLPPVQLEPAMPGVLEHHFPDRPTAMAWFEAEHDNLLAAQRVAATHHWHHIVWQLAWSVGTFHSWRGHLDDRIAVWQAVLNGPANRPDAPHGPAHRNLGRAYAEIGSHDQAIGHLSRALELSEQDEALAEQGWAHRELAWAWGRCGDHQQALPHALRAVDIFRVLDLPAWEAVTLNTLGWHTAHIGDYDIAREHCQAALALHHRSHNIAGEAATRETLGYVEHHTGRYNQAIDHYHQSLTLRSSLGNTYRSADTLDRLGHPYLASGQQSQARAVWQEALEQYRQQGRYDQADEIQRRLDALSLK